MLHLMLRDGPDFCLYSTFIELDELVALGAKAKASLSSLKLIKLMVRCSPFKCVLPLTFDLSW